MFLSIHISHLLYVRHDSVKYLSPAHLGVLYLELCTIVTTGEYDF